MMRKLFGPKDEEFDKVPDMILPKTEKKFHYDEKRKRWCFEGEDDDAIDKKSSLPPPKFEKKPDQTNTNTNTTDNTANTGIPGAPKQKIVPKKMGVMNRYASAFPTSSSNEPDEKNDAPISQQKEEPKENNESKELKIEKNMPNYNNILTNTANVGFPINYNNQQSNTSLNIFNTNNQFVDNRNFDMMLNLERQKIESEFNKKIMSLNNQIYSKDTIIGNCLEEKNDIIERYERKIRFIKGKLKESVTQNVENKLLIQNLEVKK